MTRNQQRRIGIERDLAARIAYEREERGWSYDVLAKRLTDVGCSIAASSVHKIEKGEPPRRISVDELYALSKVFDIPVDDLATPPVAYRAQHGDRLLDDYFDAVDRLVEFRVDTLEAGENVIDYAKTLTRAEVEEIVRTWVDRQEREHGPLIDPESLHVALLRFITVEGAASPFADAISGGALRVPGYEYHSPSDDPDGPGIRIPGYQTEAQAEAYSRA